MAESNPFAIRARDEVKDLFNQLADQGEFESRGEFLNQLLVMYQSEIIKNSGHSAAGLLKPAIETVETLTSKLLDVLNGTATAMAVRDDEVAEKLDLERNSFEESKSVLESEIAALRAEQAADGERLEAAQAAADEAKEAAGEWRKRAEGLESALSDKQALVEELREKNDTLAGIANEIKAAAEKGKELAEKEAEYIQQINRLETELAAAELAGERALNAQKAEFLDKIQKIQEDYQKLTVAAAASPPPAAAKPRRSRAAKDAAAEKPPTDNDK